MQTVIKKDCSILKTPDNNNKKDSLMKHYLLNHQPQKGLQAACAQQGQAPTYNARGEGHTSASPKTLTKVILVLLTMFLLPSAAWGVDEYTLGSGETLTFTKVNDDLGQYSSPEGSVWNVTLTAIEGSATTAKINDNNFTHFSELRLTSPIPYNGTMSGFTFSGTVSIDGDGSSALYPNVDQILVYKSSSASDFSGRTLIGEVTKSGGIYTYASQSSDPTVLNNDYIQVVFLRTTVNTNYAGVQFPAGNITGIAMTFEGTSYGIKVGNQRVTSNNYDDIFKDGGKVSYNSANNTLTLNGATIDGCIRYSGTNGLNIQFEGNNTITAVDSAAIRTVYLSSATPSQLPSLVLSGSGNAKLSSNNYRDYSAIAGFSQINGGLSAAYLEDYTRADFTSLTGGKDIIICNGSPYGFYVGGTIVTASNKATVLGSGVDFTPATSDVATLTFSDKATIPGELEWDLNNALKIQLSGANTVQGCIHSNKDVALSFSYPSGTNNSSLTFGNSAGTQSAISGFTEVTFPAINSPGDNKLSFDENVSYNTSDKALKNDKNEVVTSSHISYYYGLTIAGVAVTSANYEDILDGENAGKVSFTPDNNILTLKSANITVNGKNAIVSGLANLTVNLVNLDGVESVITCQGNTDLVFKGIQSGAIVTFTTDATNPGSLGGSVKQELYMFDGITPIYQNGLNYWREGDSFSIDTRCGIKIGDVAISSANVGSDGTITGVAGIKSGTVKFTPADNTTTPATPATLTLDNANFGPSLSGIVWSGDGTLKIQYSGNNIINTRNGNELNSGSSDGYCIFGNASSNLILSASDQASTLTLTPSYGGSTGSNSRAAISGFSSVSLDDSWGMYYTKNCVPASASSLTAGEEVIIIKGTPLGLSVAGVVVTNKNQTNILGDGKVSFSPAEVVSDQPSTGSNTSATLTLDDGATIEGNIQSSISPLIVHLKGSSTINPSTTNDAPFEYTGDTSSGSPALTFDSTDDEAGELTMGGTLRKDNSGSNVTLTIGGYSVTNQFDDGTGTNLTGEWIYNSTSGKHHIFRNKLYGLWVGSYQVTRANKSSISSGYPTFDEDNLALRLKEKYTGLTIKSAMPALKLFVKGECSLKNIIFDTTYNPNSEPGTLTIEKDPDPNDPATNNSLSLSNTDGGGGVITGFSKVTIKAPLHISAPNGFTEWTDAVTSATITDKADDNLLSNVLTEGVDYVTYYAADRDIYLSSYTPYVITGISGSSVVTKAISYIPKGTVAIVDKNSNTATEAVTTGNMLKYAANDVTPTTSTYVLYNGKFTRASGSIPQGMCYLDLSGVAGTRGFYDIDGGDGTTAIKDVKSGEVDGGKWADGGWHDLQGRRLSAKPTKPGLYILNGKKVVIK